MPRQPDYTPADIPDFYSPQDMKAKGFFRNVRVDGDVDFNTRKPAELWGFRCRIHKKQLIYDFESLGTGNVVYRCPVANCQSKVIRG